jgi:hypothetical protein
MARLAATLTLLLALIVAACAAPAGEGAATTSAETERPMEESPAETPEGEDEATAEPEAEGDEESAEPTEVEADKEQASGEDVSVFDLEVGDCFSGGENGEVSEVSVVDCDDEHAYEVFALVDHEAGPDDAYPGDEELEEFADDQCTGDEFESYVGISYDVSIYYSTWLTPTERSWDELGDREVVCVLYEPEDPSDPVDPKPVSGSARDSEE